MTAKQCQTTKWTATVQNMEVLDFLHDSVPACSSESPTAHCGSRTTSADSQSQEVDNQCRCKARSCRARGQPQDTNYLPFRAAKFFFFLMCILRKELSRIKRVLRLHGLRREFLTPNPFLLAEWNLISNAVTLITMHNLYLAVIKWFKCNLIF